MDYILSYFFFFENDFSISLFFIFAFFTNIIWRCFRKGSHSAAFKLIFKKCVLNKEINILRIFFTHAANHMIDYLGRKNKLKFVP